MTRTPHVAFAAAMACVAAVLPACQAPPAFVRGDVGDSAGDAGGGAPWHFERVGEAAGLVAVHDWSEDAGGGLAELLSVSGGVAAADYDDDGLVDLLTVGCSDGQTALYRNLGDGRFADVTTELRIVPAPGCDAGPLIADIDGDGHDDILIGGVAGAPVRLWLQRSAGFVTATATSGLDHLGGNVLGGAFADIDLDGDLDLALARWGRTATEQLLRNDGGRFTGVTKSAGLASLSPFTFTPNFVDIDGDDLLDLLVTADFHNTRAFLGTASGAFVDVTTPALDDENGMGAAIGDYDGDGDLDWFVASIADPDGVSEGFWGVSGNRLYRNLGGGQFEDATDEAGVRAAGWAWGSCFGDFDDDGDLDLFATNGYSRPNADEFVDDPSVLYVSSGDGTFVESAASLGLADTFEGRGVACFDYDRDGDLDIVVSRSHGPLELYRNDRPAGRHWLGVALRASAPNARAIGSRVEIVAGGRTQVGVIRAGSNYASQDPAELHFGLGATESVESITVRRPGGEVRVFGPVAADQRLTLDLR